MLGNNYWLHLHGGGGGAQGQPARANPLLQPKNGHINNQVSL